MRILLVMFLLAGLNAFSQDVAVAKERTKKKPTRKTYTAAEEPPKKTWACDFEGSKRFAELSSEERVDPNARLTSITQFLGCVRERAELRSKVHPAALLALEKQVLLATLDVMTVQDEKAASLEQANLEKRQELSAAEDRYQRLLQRYKQIESNQAQLYLQYVGHLQDDQNSFAMLRAQFERLKVPPVIVLQPPPSPRQASVPELHCVSNRVGGTVYTDCQ